MQGYSNLYDIMYSFFRNGQERINSLLKLEVNSEMLDPFTSKLDLVRDFVENYTYFVQVAFFMATIISLIIFIISILNLIFDYKT